MNIRKLLLSVIVFFSTASFAAGPALVVGVDRFAPPFAMQGAGSQVFGFDISMMEFICQQINRTCQFRLMPFDKLLDGVEQGTVEAAVGSIIITSERAQKVSFSQPYLLSESRFIGRADLAKMPFQLNLFDNRTIGMEKGTVFPEILAAMGVKSPKIIYFNTEDEIIEAISNGKVDLSLMDGPAAIYWQAQTTGILRVIGKPFTFGMGLGIAVNRSNTALLQQINSALEVYLKSNEFKRDYEKYIAFFWTL